jgi:hypothetical protein
VQDLQADQSTVGVHRTRDLAMPRDMPRHRQPAAERLEPAGDVRRQTAGHHQADATARTFGEVRRELVVVARMILKARVHRTHQHTIGQRDEAQIERREQMWKMGMCAGGVGHSVERLFESRHNAVNGGWLQVARHGSCPLAVHGSLLSRHSG